MTIEMASDIIRQTLMLSLYLIAPIVGIGIVVGLIVSLVQSITSIQEQTLTFVPKLVVMSLAIVFLSNWMMVETTDFTVQLFRMLETVAP